MNGLQDVDSTNKCFKKQAKEENVWTAKETRLVSIVIGAKLITTNRRSKMTKVEPLVNHVSVMSQVLNHLNVILMAFALVNLELRVTNVINVLQIIGTLETTGVKHAAVYVRAVRIMNPSVIKTPANVIVNRM
jgi:hypothetical protein